jgi:pectinesterase
MNYLLPFTKCLAHISCSLLLLSFTASAQLVKHNTKKNTEQNAQKKNALYANKQPEQKTPPTGKYQPSIYLVDQKANSGFTTIQSAVDASNKDKEVIILIKPGSYNEKLYITRNNLTLVGSSQTNTIIEYAELRNNWREDHSSDWGAAVVNIDATNITLVNLSVVNNYGRKHNTDEHQFAVRGFENTDKIIFNNCTMIADGADTVSLWNKSTGKYYHSYCHFEGYTDMVCPRGSALIEHSSFYNHKQTATLWHDGELNEQHKFVVSKSRFDGTKDFWLGRHHYDAQFYLLDSEFSNNLADLPIFRKTYRDSSRNRANLYGDRYYFLNSKNHPSYSWLNDNFSKELKVEIEQQRLENFTFNHQWQPSNALKQLAAFLESADLGDFSYQPISGI